MSVRKKIDISVVQNAQLTSEGNDSDLAFLKANGPRVLPNSPTASKWDAESIKRQFYKQPEILFTWLQNVAAAQLGLAETVDDYFQTIEDTLVHLAGTETITGAKTFTANVSFGSSESDNSKTLDIYFTINLRGPGPVTSVPIMPGNAGFSIGASDNRWNTVYAQYIDVSQSLKHGEYTLSLPSHTGTLMTDDDLDAEIDKIRDGVYTAKKAEKDGDGNTIKDTYETKAAATAKVARSNLVDIIKVMGATGNANTEGLLSSTDKAFIDMIRGLWGTEADVDDVVNKISEILEIFDNYPEGATLTEALSLKLSKTEAQGTYMAKSDALAVGFLQVSGYDESTGKISIIHSSDFNLSYDSDTGVLTVSVN